MTDRLTVHAATYDLLRRLGLTTMFGNPGSTEETFLKNFPADFTYVLALQEASVVAMADGYAQATRRPALVNLHTAAGLGNAMGSMVAAYQGNTPLVVTASQQTREMVIHDPYLANIDATEMPKPWVKWSLQPGHPQDVPAALMRAYAIAQQPPAGPVFVSLPFGDWAEPALAGDSLLGDTRLALEQLFDVIDARQPAAVSRPRPGADGGPSANTPLSPPEVYAALASVKPVDAVLVNEATSAMAERRHWLPVTRSASYYTTPSGGLGWAMPAAVGIALADRIGDVHRAVLVTIGDGSFQYSIQSLWTAAQHGLPLVAVVLANAEYSVLKSFAHLEDTPGVPGLDIPGLDIVSAATGFGCRAVTAATAGEITEQFTRALSADRPTVIVIPTKSQLADLG